MELFTTERKAGMFLSYEFIEILARRRADTRTN
jgi:hypothetical protein